MDESRISEKVRQISKVFLRLSDEENRLTDGIRVVAEATAAAALLVDSDGSLLGSTADLVKGNTHLERLIIEKSIAHDLELMPLLRNNAALINHKASPKTAAKREDQYSFFPIKSDSLQLAGLFLYHPARILSSEEIIIAEIGATLLGTIIVQQLGEKEAQNQRNRQLAEGAFESLSYSEVEAIREILKNINNNESVVVASKIADSLGITRSVIVNALRKFESAGIIESRSLGMKGTFIRVKNHLALEMVATRSEKIN